MTNMVIVQQGGGKYLFAVPDGYKLYAGDRVLCKTKRGNTPGLCICDSFVTNKEEEIGKAMSSNFPLAPIIGTYILDLFQKEE